MKTSTLVELANSLRQALSKESAFSGDGEGVFKYNHKIALTAFGISDEDVNWLQHLGLAIYSFYQVCNSLYLSSKRGLSPSWISEYLDLGKPSHLIEVGLVKHFRNDLPLIIRPDLLLTEEGAIVSELDSVPGGVGYLDFLNHAYSSVTNCRIVGENKVAATFAEMLSKLVVISDQSGVIVILVSEESNAYRPEMEWLIKRVSEEGYNIYLAKPQEIEYSEEGCFLSRGSCKYHVAAVYRFFELFDLDNVNRSNSLIRLAISNKVEVTPPFKPYLEEKMWLALFHHPSLSDYWKEKLGITYYNLLRAVFPKSWIIDSRPAPPQSFIHGFELSGHPISNWEELNKATQRERRVVLKPSGFSERAWGSRGVVIGHDVSATEWSRSLQSALSAFFSSPEILQEFKQTKLYELECFDSLKEEKFTFLSRIRLCPYYFVVDGFPKLVGAHITACSADKKIIHGMKDAVMAPCSVVANLYDHKLVPSSFSCLASEQAVYQASC